MCVCVCFTEEGNTGRVEGDEEEVAAALPQSQLVRWKSVSLSEVQVYTQEKEWHVNCHHSGGHHANDLSPSLFPFPSPSPPLSPSLSLSL